MTSQREADAVLLIMAVLGGEATKLEVEQILLESGVMRCDDATFRRWAKILGPFVHVQCARQTGQPR